MKIDDMMNSPNYQASDVRPSQPMKEDKVSTPATTSRPKVNQSKGKARVNVKSTNEPVIGHNRDLQVLR